MVNPRLFWAAVIMLALIPVLCIDISEHVLAWEKDVREEMINVVQNVYDLSREQKARILDSILERNYTLNMLIYFKGFLAVALLVGGIWLLVLYKRITGKLAKPLAFTIVLMVLFIGAKYAWALTLSPQNKNIKFVEVDNAKVDLNKIEPTILKGKWFMWISGEQPVARVWLSSVILQSL